MNTKRLFAFVLVFIFSILGAVFIKAAMTPAEKKIRTVSTASSTTSAPAVEVLKVLVAQRDLDDGSFIDKGDVTWEEKEVTGSGWIRSHQFELDDFTGAVVFKKTQAGEAIAYRNLIRPQQQGFLAAVLAPESRAISIPVNEVTANAGLIGPGDFVDILLTFYADSDRGERALQRGRDISMLTSKTLASAIRVIAINRQSVANPNNDLGILITTATLEVSPKLAQHLTIANRMGELALSLRSKRDPGNVTAMEAWSGDVHTAVDQLKPDPGLVLMRGSSTQIVGYPQHDDNTKEKEKE